MTETPNVLVVDDEIQIRRFLRAGFELEGFVIHEAKDAAEALRAATLRSIDLVILDLALPDLDGAEVLERLRAWSSVRSSCCRCVQTKTKKCVCWNSAQTTTWSSRSEWRSCWRAQGRRCAATRVGRAVRVF